MRQEAQELIEALGRLHPLHLSGDATAALGKLTRALSAPPATRHTVIGDLPIDVNSIDKLDAVLSATLDTLKNAQAAEAQARAAAHVTRLAVAFADADLAVRRHVDGEAEYVELRKRRRAARKAYREHVESQE